MTIKQLNDISRKQQNFQESQHSRRYNSVSPGLLDKVVDRDLSLIGSEDAFLHISSRAKQQESIGSLGSSCIQHETEQQLTSN